MNIWHWIEWVFPSQSKGKLREILVDIVVENARNIEGKCSSSCHKGKQIFFCQWNTKLGWKGTIKESGVKHKGQIEIANFSEENEVDDTEVNLSQKKGDEDIVKNIKKKKKIRLHRVREISGNYLKPYKTGFTWEMVLSLKTLAT